MEKKGIVVIGAGNIGSMIADWLQNTGDYQVTITDHDKSVLDGLKCNSNVERHLVDASQAEALEKVFSGKFAVLSAAPFFLTTTIAKAAAAAKIHYLDLTEDVASTRNVKETASSAETAFIPQCGLAPGFITIVANDICKQFDDLFDVRMRVGALPEFPSNALNYNLTWSTDGVINEYCEPCEAIVNGVLREVPPLEENEAFSLDGVQYEAFNTSGGLGTMCETLQGKVRNLNYRTIRYPGHCDIMKALLQDLRLRDRRELLKDIFENSLPTTSQDVVIVFVTVSGLKNGKLCQDTYANKVYAQDINGVVRSAIQITTAAGICAVLDLLSQGVLKTAGLIRQEDINLDDFLNNRFGSYFRPAKQSQLVAAE